MQFEIIPKKIYQKSVYTEKKSSHMYCRAHTNWQLSRKSFGRLRLISLYTLYILEVILFVQQKSKATTSRQVHNHLITNSSDYHQQYQNFELYNSRQVIAAWIQLCTCIQLGWKSGM